MNDKKYLFISCFLLWFRYLQCRVQWMSKVDHDYQFRMTKIRTALPAIAWTIRKIQTVLVTVAAVAAVQAVTVTQIATVSCKFSRFILSVASGDVCGIAFDASRSLWSAFNSIFIFVVHSNGFLSWYSGWRRHLCVWLPPKNGMQFNWIYALGVFMFIDIVFLALAFLYRLFFCLFFIYIFKQCKHDIFIPFFSSLFFDLFFLFRLQFCFHCVSFFFSHISAFDFVDEISGSAGRWFVTNWRSCIGESRTVLHDVTKAEQWKTTETSSTWYEFVFTWIANGECVFFFLLLFTYWISIGFWPIRHHFSSFYLLVLLLCRFVGCHRAVFFTFAFARYDQVRCA